MDSKKKNKIEEPFEIYEVTQNNEATSEALHPVLTELLKKSKENHTSGKVFSHERAMDMYKEKIASNK